MLDSDGPWSRITGLGAFLILHVLQIAYYKLRMFHFGMQSTVAVLKSLTYLSRVTESAWLKITKQTHGP